MDEKNALSETNERKYEIYVNRVNEAVRKIVHERRAIVKKGNPTTLTLD